VSAYTVKGKIATSVLFEALFAVTVYRVVSFTSVGVPLMVQVVLLILKPAGSAGVIVQLAIASPELLKVIYTKIYSTYGAFAALKADGTIVAWANSRFGGEGAPSGSGYTKIYSTGSAYLSPQLGCH
jgi:hypothetical protein